MTDSPSRSAAQNSFSDGDVSLGTGNPSVPLEETPLDEISKFTRFLWWCAGADARLLAWCPYSDRAKFQGLGGAVLTTGALAFLSGSYAFYIVFSPKDGTALQSDIHLPSAAIAALFGSVWALIIFNFDRFIVSSSGKGDGTDRVTPREMWNALPRLLMAFIIGIVMSAPLELKVLESEIEAELEADQKQFLYKLDTGDSSSVEAERSRTSARIAELQQRLDEGEATIEKRRVEIVQQRKQLELEAEGKTGSHAAGRGPAWQDKKDNLDQLEVELQRDRASLETKMLGTTDELRQVKGELGALDGKTADMKRSNALVAKHRDGLMTRLRIADEKGGAVPWMLRLLMLMIEVGPIFFKMMVTRGVYDYLDENRKHLARAQLGIEPNATMISVGGAGGKAKQELVDRHLGAEAVIAEERRRIETEAILAAEVHEEFRRRTITAIREDPSRFQKL